MGYLELLKIKLQIGLAYMQIAWIRLKYMPKLGYWNSRLFASATRLRLLFWWELHINGISPYELEQIVADHGVLIRQTRIETTYEVSGVKVTFRRE